MIAVTDDLIPIPMRFHREIFLPDFERLIGGLRDEMTARFDQVFGQFGAIHRRFDRLEAEYHRPRR
jgi:hypothetical protein